MSDSEQSGRSAEARVAKFLELLHERIQASRFTSAARLIREAARKGLVPQDASFIDWLAKHTDATAVARVIDSGFALLNSACCDTGFEECHACNGTGIRGDNGCLNCATIGRLRCPFCNGSSLVPFGEFPAPLRMPTAKARVAVAEEHLGRLLAENIPDCSGDLSATVELRHHAMNCDKLLGVLENVAIEFRHAAEKPPSDLLARLGGSAKKARHRQIATLKRLAECWSEVASAGGDQAADAEAKAATLEEICLARSFHVTELAHPFLFREDSPPPAPASNASDDAPADQGQAAPQPPAEPDSEDQ